MIDLNHKTIKTTAKFSLWFAPNKKEWQSLKKLILGVILATFKIKETEIFSSNPSPSILAITVNYVHGNKTEKK